jgi:hypothetical protein
MSFIIYFWIIHQIHFFPSKKKEKEKENNETRHGAVLNDIVVLPFPLPTQKQGRRRFFYSIFSHLFSSSPLV